MSTRIFAQSGGNTGLTGTVTDPSGAAVVSAAITVTRAETGESRRTSTNEEGKWDVRFLTVGVYDVKVEAPKFRTMVRSGLAVTTGVVVTVHLELTLGEQAESVSVNPVADPVSRDSASIVKELESVELENLPTSARNFTQLLLIEPGVSADISACSGGAGDDVNEGGEACTGEGGTGPRPGVPAAIRLVADRPGVLVTSPLESTF